ncbi:MAG TPA: VIT domain-containing protein [Gemmatimonadaceae bacterium]|nr:VIT domain-containing protein [Gemmatimonadaceae bacterium]
MLSKLSRRAALASAAALSLTVVLVAACARRSGPGAGYTADSAAADASGTVAASPAAPAGNIALRSAGFAGKMAAAASDSLAATADELLVIESERQEAAKTELRASRTQLRRLEERMKLLERSGRPVRRDSVAAAMGIPRMPPPPATQGTLRARSAEGEELGDFPLQHTRVAAEVSGYMARTVVHQRYANPYAQVIEAVYVFPLGSMAAVHDFVMQSGGRRIVGVVRERAEAERIYQEARARGQTASLLTQERPNIFTQNVANIEPGGEVTISITYVEQLAADHGSYQYVFPMVVGPRYNPVPPPTDPNVLVSNGRSGSEDSIVASQPDPTAVASPPVLRPGRRGGHDISLTLRLDSPFNVRALSSPTHRIVVDGPSPESRVVRLADDDSIPNRDFVLRWTVAGDQTEAGVLTHRPEAGEDGYFTLAVQPPLRPSDEQVMPREITFIMDVSGSMMGTPIEIAKGVVTRTLGELRPEDHFNIVYFAGGNAQLWERARPRSRANVSAAKAFLQNLQAGGGTEMLAGLQRALHAEHDDGLLQMYVFLTDGFVGDEERILRTVRLERGDSRFFGFGIGSSVNRFLIDGIGEHGGGLSMVVLPSDPRQTQAAVSRLFDAIDSPVLVDVAVDWNGLPVRDVYPAKLRDLFAGATINLVGRYRAPAGEAASGTAYVTGRVGTRRVRLPVQVTLPAREPSHAALAPTWARQRIHELTSKMLAAESEGERESLRRTITRVAIEHHLMSQYTSFVAVDASRVVGDGHPVTILQPVELPAGVSYEGIFGEAPAGGVRRLGAWGVTLQETESGRVRVGEVTSDGPASRAGVRAGAVLRAVDGRTVGSISALEDALLQGQSGRERTVEFDAGRKVRLPNP